MAAERKVSDEGYEVQLRMLDSSAAWQKKRKLAVRPLLRLLTVMERVKCSQISQ